MNQPAQQQDVPGTEITLTAADVASSSLFEHDDAQDTLHEVEKAGCRCILVSNAAYQMARESLQDIPDDEWTPPSPRTSPPPSISRRPRSRC